MCLPSKKIEDWAFQAEERGKAWKVSPTALQLVGGDKFSKVVEDVCWSQGSQFCCAGDRPLFPLPGHPLPNILMSSLLSEFQLWIYGSEFAESLDFLFFSSSCPLLSSSPYFDGLVVSVMDTGWESGCESPFICRPWNCILIRHQDRLECPEASNAF